MADRIVEIGITDIRENPADPTGWLVYADAMSVTATGAERLSEAIPVAATDTIAQWETKRRDRWRAAAGKPTAPVILISYKVAP